MTAAESSPVELVKRAAIEHFGQADERLHALAVRHLPGIDLPTPLPYADRAAVLMKSVVSQQISVKAASSIWSRLYPGLFTTAGRPANPDISILTAAGASTAKAQSLLALSRALSAGRLDMSSFDRWTNERIVEHLVQYPGVGPWTAEMFLISGLGRADVFSLRDLGLRTALSRLHDLPAEIERLKPLAQTYSPYGTLAALVCWRSLDNGDLPARS